MKVFNKKNERKPVLALYLPSLCGGGAERVMLTLANGMAERGLKVDLVLAKAEGPYLADVAPGVRVVDLGAKRVLASLPALVHYLRTSRPQAMLSALNHANVVAVIARALAFVPTRLVVSEHNNVSLSGYSRRSIFARALLPLMRWTYPRADEVIAVSGGVADDLALSIGLPRESISVVYNPVVTDNLLVQASAPVEHPWFSIDASPVIIGVGRLTAQKDFPTLIRAFAKVRALRPCRLVILGEGELRSELEALVTNLGLSADIALPGFVSNPYAWMHKASLFVLSSAWEGLPTVLIEAMACGTSVVSTDCPSGPTEILEHGKWGSLVAVGDVDGLAKAMNNTLNDERRPEIVSRANDFGITQALLGYLDLLLHQNNIQK